MRFKSSIDNVIITAMMIFLTTYLEKSSIFYYLTFVGLFIYLEMMTVGSSLIFKRLFQKLFLTRELLNLSLGLIIKYSGTYQKEDMEMTSMITMKTLILTNNSNETDKIIEKAGQRFINEMMNDHEKSNEEINN